MAGHCLAGPPNLNQWFETDLWIVWCSFNVPGLYNYSILHIKQITIFVSNIDTFNRKYWIDKTFTNKGGNSLSTLNSVPLLQIGKYYYFNKVFSLWFLINMLSIYSNNNTFFHNEINICINVTLQGGFKMSRKKTSWMWGTLIPLGNKFTTGK